MKKEGKKRALGLKRRWLRNTLSVVLPLAVVCVFAVTAVFANYYYSTMESDLSYRARTTADFFSDYMNLNYSEYYQSCVKYAETFEERNTIELQFINSGGQLVASSYGPWAGKSPETSEIAQAMQTRTQAVFVGTDLNTGERIMAVSSPMIYSNGEVIGVLRFVTSTRVMDFQIGLIGLIAAACCALFVLLTIVSSNYYIHSILEPLEDITEKAKRIAGGSYGVQIQTKYDDEIGELADTINDLSVQINQNEKTQTEFISSLSHELRTPLTAITGWSETLLQDESMDQDTRRGMMIILREARRLTEMVVDLLDFTRIQDGRMTLNIEPTDLRSEFEDTVFMYGSRLKQEGITIHYEDNDEDIPEILCDPKRMRQVFLNIFDNAAKHGGGEVIDAYIRLREQAVVIYIRDYGPGIPEDELSLVKKKFYKGSSKARGSGIGLAVCDEIMQMHGGWLHLENAKGGGTVVAIGLPLTQ